ncbi:MAG TPA: hypothetical protein DCM87_16585 [Planctomycetes bacterium]|nr:hypothetical protein [Planctomycetota bacterium]
MAITVARLKEALPGVLVEPPGLRWNPGDTPFFYYPPLETDWGQIRLLVHLQDEGRFLQFRSIDLFTLSENQRVREQQIEILLAHNYRKKSVQFGYDPEDGEVCAYVDLPVLDNEEISRRLMERVLTSIRLSGSDLLRELRQTEKTAPLPAEPPAKPGKEKLLKTLIRRVCRLVYGKLIER